MKRSAKSLLYSVVVGASALGLAACGGGDDESSNSGGGGGSTLTFSAANPASQNTTVDVSTAKTIGNDARAADAFSSVPYCDVYFEDATGANGKRYALQVYFRQTDRLPINASIVEGAGAAMWVAFDNDSGKAISGITVDTAARTLAFAAKVLKGSSGETVTINGTASFPKNATGTAGCGA
ncbi:MAG TPA: hypothetical protein PL196_10780 [Burkholderiaceae bacterium]|nr:hypothetical protein [Burkholderiaceae bacterium]